MSYILDALRKSEQERQRGKVPDFYGSHDTPAEPTKRFNFWPLVTVIVVIINLGILGYFVWGGESQPQQAADNIATEGSSAEQPVESSSPAAAASQPVNTSLEAKQPRNPAPENPQSAQNEKQPVAITPNPAVSNSEPAQQASTPAPSVAYLPQLEELSPADRQGIPDMTFSSHMYSSMPKFRSIIINGKRLKEGQYFNADIQVREITEAGVIMSHDGTLFEVDVLGRWAQ